jgi:regulator of sigma E protease
MITSIVAAVVIFAVLIIVHEAGHFMMAKRLGVRVLRFSIGYPPRVIGFRRGETDYAIGATPLGGYVRMLGDEIADEPSADTIKAYLKEIQLDLIGSARGSGWLAGREKAGDNDSMLADIARELVPAGVDADAARQTAVLGRMAKPDETVLLRETARLDSAERAFAILADARPPELLREFNARAFPSQRLAKRFAIVLAGPVANLIFAPILMMIVFMVGVPTVLPVLGTVKAGTPAARAGLQPGDRIMSVDGHAVDSWDDLSTIVKSSHGAPLRIVIERASPNAAARMVSLPVKPELLPEATIYGSKSPTWVIGVTPRGDQTTQRYSFPHAVASGFIETGRMLGTLFVGVAKIFEGATPVRQALGGPIMIAQIAGREAHQGFADVALFTVMLSLELGIINLFPVPLLDGGHLLFFTIEGIRGKPLQLRHREIAMQVGLFLLVVLMAFVIMNDISRIIG